MTEGAVTLTVAAVRAEGSDAGQSVLRVSFVEIVVPVCLGLGLASTQWLTVRAISSLNFYSPGNFPGHNGWQSALRPHYIFYFPGNFTGQNG